ncbi:MAG: type I methionyl aminopeptidase [Armatimonadetes bacterium]|nr:type I methionyl aminopeptidase [Armatimonadota bacterium]
MTEEEAPRPNPIRLKRPQDIEKIRQGGLIVSEVLALLRDAVRPGISTLELDDLARLGIERRGGSPSFLGHRHGEHVYHHSLCASVNEQVVHGVPRADCILKEGDLVSLDIGVKYRGFHADSALTVAVGRVSDEAARLMAVTQESLWRGIRAIRKNGRLQDIGRAVQRHVEANGFSVVRILTGHGIGRELWEGPEVLNYEEAGRPNISFCPGMVIAIEPMVNAGSAEVCTLADNWTIATKDGRLSAHYEHTVAMTPRGCEVLTLGPHDPGP